MCNIIPTNSTVTKTSTFAFLNNGNLSKAQNKQIQNKTINNLLKYKYI